MTEEQFWHSNPRLIKAYEKAWKQEQNWNNQLMYTWMGGYVQNAVTVALSQVLTPMFCKGKHSNASFMDEPIRIFPKTEEEKQAEYEQMTQAFIAWGDAMIKKYKKPDS